jgi:hypothetical protein
MFPADVRAAGLDCMTSGTYKWLLGGFGVAPFFVRRELLEKIRVDRLGALHVERELGDHRYEIYRTAKKFEYATLPFAEIYQLGAALAYLERVGVDRIERHTVALARELREGLAGLGFRLLEGITPIIPVVVDDEARVCRFFWELMGEGIYTNPVAGLNAKHLGLKAPRPKSLTEKHHRLQQWVHSPRVQKTIGCTLKSANANP